MSDQANETASEDETPVTLVEGCIVTRLLGKIRVEGAKVVGRPKVNSTRWMFDIEAPGGEDVTVELVAHYGDKKYVADLMSVQLTPLSDSFYDARPVAEFNADDTLVITSKPIDGTFRCSVTVDAMASQSR